mmetsp:Transcript_25930/g.75070  ORF Transcript_25930/g.75070 Transcript_25930/m.75070 type:complete len:200 (-) Transcript_25930:15-614(-)
MCTSSSLPISTPPAGSSDSESAPEAEDEERTRSLASPTAPPCLGCARPDASPSESWPLCTFDPRVSEHPRPSASARHFSLTSPSPSTSTPVSASSRFVSFANPLAASWRCLVRSLARTVSLKAARQPHTSPASAWCGHVRLSGSLRRAVGQEIRPAPVSQRAIARGAARRASTKQAPSPSASSHPGCSRLLSARPPSPA